MLMFSAEKVICCWFFLSNSFEIMGLYPCALPWVEVAEDAIGRLMESEVHFCA